MIAVTVPIAIPISRASRENMLAGLGAIIISETIAAGALEGAEISVVPRSREPIDRIGTVESAVRVIKRTQTIAARALDCLKISIALESRDTIGAIKGSRRKLALTKRRDVPTRAVVASLREALAGHRAHTHRREVL
jgi:hypothetical protein